MSLGGRLDSLAQGVEQLATGPAEHWNPPFCGDLDMRIRADGRWLYQGQSMQREALVRLFASVLRLEGDDYYLVTPVEKLRIQVEDAPFISQALEISGQGPHQQIRLHTTVGDSFNLGAAHALELRTSAHGEQRPYVHVRKGLWALLQRSHFYQLAELLCCAEGTDSGALGIYADGHFFELYPTHPV